MRLAIPMLMAVVVATAIINIQYSLHDPEINYYWSTVKGPFNNTWIIDSRPSLHLVQNVFSEVARSPTYISAIVVDAPIDPNVVLQTSVTVGGTTRTLIIEIRQRDGRFYVCYNNAVSETSPGTPINVTVRASVIRLANRNIVIPLLNESVTPTELPTFTTCRPEAFVRLRYEPGARHIFIDTVARTYGIFTVVTASHTNTLTHALTRLTVTVDGVTYRIYPLWIIAHTSISPTTVTVRPP